MTGTVEPVVVLDKVSKRFGATVALDSLDLAIEAGEFVTLLGPSGCGKSTTLRIVGGFERPDSGRVRIAGEDVTALPANRRDVNMVFQDYALFPHLSVGRNIAFGLELLGQSSTEIDRRVTELLRFLELSDLRDRAPDQLSGGQRQRVALARALARNPRVLLLDEPLGALDAKLRSQVQIELKSIQQRTGKTFVFVTHDQEEALTMSDRIVVMNAGLIEQSGTPEQLYRLPASRFVAEFIGESNLFEAAVLGVAGRRVVLDWHGHQLSAIAHAGQPAVGQTVTVLLRPEDILLSSSQPARGNVLEARIVHRLYKGSRTAVDLRAADADTLLKAYLDPHLEADLTHDFLWMSWAAERLLVLT